MRKPATEEIASVSVELWDTEVCFLHIQLTRTNVRLPKKHRIPPEVDFESSSSPAKSDSRNNPNRQCCAEITHMAILSVVTRAVNVGNQTSQASETSSCPFCDCSCQFVHRPKNVWSSTASHVQAFQDDLRADLWQMLPLFPILPFFWIDGRQDMTVETLYSCSIVLFANSQYRSAHVLPCHKTKRSCSHAISLSQATFQSLWQM